ncbi:MAG: hypothetical protein JRI25_19525 [Deltaproteobacteria bacterium]|nr:hypothetical protein [Deltaproteobacteria bacterium]
MADTWESHVIPHGTLNELLPGLWEVTGSSGPLPRTMTVFRLKSSGLWLHSAVALDDDGMAALEALGPPEVLVVPSGMHRLDAAVYKQRYPDIQVICPRQARKAVEKVVAVDADAEDVLEEQDIAWQTPPGMKPDELVFELPVEGGRALLFCDALFNLDHLPGLKGWILKTMGSTGFFGTTFIGRFFSRDKAGWKGWLEAQGERDDIRAIVVTHGTPITADCAQRMGEAAARL